MVASLMGEGRGSGGGGGGSGRGSGGHIGRPGRVRAGGGAPSKMECRGPGDDDRSPIMELNTTPLIDVMLVLLVMLIITIPPQTHNVPLALPAITDLPPTDALRNRLTLDQPGVARWNGEAVDDATLAALLRGVAAMDRPAEVHFEPDAAARYERVDGVLALASRSGVETLGFVGNERYRDSF